MTLIMVLVFASVFLMAYALLVRVAGPRLIVTERLADAADTYRVSRRPSQRWSSLPAADRLMGRLNLARGLEDLLDQSDLPMKPFEFILVVVVTALAFAVAGLLAGVPTALVYGLAAAGASIPLFWVHGRRRRRQNAFDRQLPDALQTISNTMRAGFGFSQGMAVVASDLPPPISVEFSRAQREMNLGLTVEETLQSLAHRMKSQDFDLAVSGILINRQVGGNLAELLDHITATIRERVKLKGFISVVTAEQRLSAVVIMAVPPVILAILLVAWQEYSRYLIVTRLGQVLLGVSLALQLIGLYFIRRIVTIDV